MGKISEIFKISNKHLYAAIRPTKILLDKEIIYCKNTSICSNCCNNGSSNCKYCPKIIERNYNLCPHDCKNYNCRETNNYCKYECLKCAKISDIKRNYILDEKRNFGINNNLKPLSRLQILQYLYLCARSAGSSCVKKITPKEISYFLNCNIKTVVINMNELVSKGYILYSVQQNFYYIILNNYSDMFKDKAHGGTGYTELTKDMLIYLCNIKNIDELRFYIRTNSERNKQLKTDNSKIPYIDRKYIKSVFPYLKKSKFLHYLEKYNIRSGGLNNKIYYLPKDNTLDYCVTMHKVKIVDSIKEYIKSLNLNVNLDTITDITVLALNFGLKTIKDALDLYSYRYVKNKNKIENVGAYIRKLALEAV